jgi:hypothetical protein
MNAVFFVKLQREGLSAADDMLRPFCFTRRIIAHGENQIFHRPDGEFHRVFTFFSFGKGKSGFDLRIHAGEQFIRRAPRPIFEPQEGHGIVEGGRKHSFEGRSWHIKDGAAQFAGIHRVKNGAVISADKQIGQVISGEIGN